MKIARKKSRLNKTVAVSLVLGLFGVIVLPLLWFLFCRQADFFLDSTSDVGGRFGHYSQLVALAVAYALFCEVGGWIAVKSWGYKGKIIPVLYTVGIVLFLVTCIIPYDPNCQGALMGYDQQKALKLSEIHNVLARVSIGFCLIPLLVLQVALFWKNKAFAIISVSTLLTVVGVVIALIVKNGTCSIGECILQNYLSVYIFVAYVVSECIGTYSKN